MQPSCIVCRGDAIIHLASLPSVPVLCNQVLRDQAAARTVTRASIELVGCRGCGHMFNAAVDPRAIDYDAAYENSLLGSPRYRTYTAEIIERIRGNCGGAAGTVVEIGCGRGEFLRMLCEQGFDEGIGFDPARPNEQSLVGDAALSIFGTVFDPSRAPRADLVCSRHVLEHLPDPVALLRQVSGAYAQQPARLVFLEVPNGSFTLHRLGIWDLIYEHVSYFTQWSLRRALTLAGLMPGAVDAVFGEQFLVAEATFASRAPTSPSQGLPSELLSDFAQFSDRFESMVADWGAWLAQARQDGRMVALWGGGSKGVTFLNLLDRSEEPAVSYVIDANPLKAGAFVAGTGHPIRSPEAVGRVRPDTILLMNPEYEAEVRAELQRMGETIEIAVVSGERPPPSRRQARQAFVHTA